MSIEIIRSGLQSTLVGAERVGYRNIGIGPGGAMDIFAIRTANFLLGNDEKMAVIEMNSPASEILFRQSHLISIAGTGFEVLLNEIKVPSWKPIWVAKDSVLKFVFKSPGGRVYLAVKRGWAAQEWLGSCSTHLGVGAGGYFGKVLKRLDVLESCDNNFNAKETEIFPWRISKNELDKVYSPSKIIRVTANAETDLLSSKSKEDFLVNHFLISNKCNRIGYRLEGAQIYLERPMELISSPVDFGTVQLLPDGNLIILMADHQTTGGYPRIASVVRADIPKLAQLGPSEKIQFKMISLYEAELLLLSREKQLNEIKSSCYQQISKYLAL